MNLSTMHATGQVDAASDVAPLVRASQLNRAPIAPVQLCKIVRLQQHIAELSKGYASPLPFQALTDRLLLDHAAH